MIAAEDREAARLDPLPRPGVDSLSAGNAHPEDAVYVVNRQLLPVRGLLHVIQQAWRRSGAESAGDPMTWWSLIPSDASKSYPIELLLHIAEQIDDVLWDLCRCIETDKETLEQDPEVLCGQVQRRRRELGKEGLLTEREADTIEEAEEILRKRWTQLLAGPDQELRPQLFRSE